MEFLTSKTDRWIPWTFVAFFAVIALVNAVFVTIALRSQPGVVTENAYEKGLAYNDTLARAEAFAHSGMSDSVSFDGRFLRWRLAEADGSPVHGAEVHARLARPVHDGYDFVIALQETQPGLYEAHPEFPLPGQWKAGLSAEWNNRQYQTTYRLSAP